MEFSKNISFEPFDQLCRTKTAKPDFLSEFLNGEISPLLYSAKDAAEQLISGLNTLLNRLSAFVSLPEGPEFQEERLIENIKMMEYYRTTDVQTYFHYVHTLYLEHMRSKPPNFIEAGIVLLLHAKELDWSNTRLKPFETNNPKLPLPAQTSKERKEALYSAAIKCFESANCFEKAELLTKEIVEVLSSDPKNFKKIIPLIKSEANYFSNIADGLSHDASKYFHVGYYGEEFPLAIRGKEFVYRCKEGEEANVLAKRLTAKFSNVRIVSSKESVPNSIPQGSQYVFVTFVRPSCVEESQGKKRTGLEGIPAPVRKYFENTDVSVFVSNGFCEDGQPKKTFMFTADKFPFVLKRSEVTSRTEMKISKLNVTADQVQEKIDEVSQIEKKKLSGDAMVSAQSRLKSILESYICTSGLFAMNNDLYAGQYPPSETESLTEKLNELALALEKAIKHAISQCSPDATDLRSKFTNNSQQVSELKKQILHLGKQIEPNFAQEGQARHMRTATMSLPKSSSFAPGSSSSPILPLQRQFPAPSMAANALVDGLKTENPPLLRHSSSGSFAAPPRTPPTMSPVGSPIPNRPSPLGSPSISPATNIPQNSKSLTSGSVGSSGYGSAPSLGLSKPFPPKPFSETPSSPSPLRQPSNIGIAPSSAPQINMSQTYGGPPSFSSGAPTFSTYNNAPPPSSPQQYASPPSFRQQAPQVQQAPPSPQINMSQTYGGPPKPQTPQGYGGPPPMPQQSQYASQPQPQIHAPQFNAIPPQSTPINMSQTYGGPPSFRAQQGPPSFQPPQGQGQGQGQVPMGRAMPAQRPISQFPSSPPQWNK